MKKQLLIWLCLILTANSIYGQIFEKIFSYSSGGNTNEYSYAGIQSTGGNYLAAIGNKIVCLSANGDSLWTKTYNGYGDITKLFRDNANQLIAATTLGKMVFLKINESNGDTIASIKVPVQYSNYGYTIYDALVLPNGDYVYAYNNGGGYGGVLRRFTPGSTTNKWANDYAGQNWAPKSIFLDDTNIVVAGYRGTSTLVDLYVRKITPSNNILWSKQLKRNTYYADRLIGIKKNTTGNYLIATSFAINNKLVPSIAVISASGDSLAVNSIATYNGIEINHGYLTSLQQGTNGSFYAAGYLNYNSSDPTNNSTSMGYMSAFLINDVGQIIGAATYNKVGFYLPYVGSPYAGSEGWGNGCFLTDDGYYLLYGVGNRIYISGTGATAQPQWRAYVVKSNQFATTSSITHLAKKNNTLFLYPNPTSDLLTVTTNALVNEGILNIYNVLGIKVYSLNNIKNTTQVQVNTTPLPKGIYTLELSTNQGAFITKFEKE